jgi:hypothetical protein
VKAAEQGLLGVVKDAVQMSGMTVSAEQLGRMVEEEQESRSAAERFIESGGTTSNDPLAIDASKDQSRRVTKNRKAVAGCVKKYGMARVQGDLDQYAQELNMDRRTLEHWLDDIKQRGL